ncbi:MFS general substrate transporter [Thozetella sp. PMI_491]|nr:MFS general substrate transporter [Thozetella sp. PMI_491]
MAVVAVIAQIVPRLDEKKNNPVPAAVLDFSKNDKALTNADESAMPVAKPPGMILDFSLLLILIAALFVVAVDHGNISSTLTSTILTDLGINTNHINNGAQLFLAGIVIFELPSNILLQHLPAHPFLSAQIFCWGLIATFQAFIQNYSSFLATRFLLGLFEAGFVPGGIYLLTLWYKSEEYSSRIAFYYLGKTLSSALSALLAAGILNLEGVGGWGGWRWLFCIEGLMTISVAAVFLLFVPQSVANPRPLIGANRWKYFTSQQEHILAERLALSGVEDPASDMPTFKNVLRSFVNYRLWLHVAVTMLTAAAMHGLISYTPLMIKSFGFSRVESNALASVGYFGNVIFTLGLAVIGERTGGRGPVVVVAVTWSVITYSCLNIIPTLTQKWTQFAILTLTNVGGTTVHVLNVGWLMYHTRSKVARGVYSALMVMAVNLGGLSGANVLREEDRPLYINAIILAGIYIFEERRGRTRQEQDTD